MASEPLHIFDPRRTMHVQGFTGRGATTTVHDASDTGISISGIFQAAEDFAVLCLYNAYDYFNHLRLKPLPRTGLSGLKLEFDIEYDPALDGAVRFDANKYPSVSWDAMIFVCGDEIYEVRLLDHAAVVSGAETPAHCTLEPSEGTMDMHVYFRDQRWTKFAVDCKQVTQLSADIEPNTDDAPQWIPIGNITGFDVSGVTVVIEHTGRNEEAIGVLDYRWSPPAILGVVTIKHPAGSYVVRFPRPFDVMKILAGEISGDISATAVLRGPVEGGKAALQCTFGTQVPPSASYGPLGNMDRMALSSPGGGSITSKFQGGANTRKHHITLDFTEPLLDKLGRTVPMDNCRKMYMVFAPRFEQVEGELEVGCFLTDDVNSTDATWAVDDSSKLTGGRYYIGSATAEERIQLIYAPSKTQIVVQRGFESSTPQAWPAGTRLKKISPVTGFAGDVEWGCTLSNISVTGDRSLKVGGGAARIEESDSKCAYAGFWEQYAYGAGWPTQWWAGGHAVRCAPANGGDLRQVTIRYNHNEVHELYLGTFLAGDCGKISVAVDGGAATTHDLFSSEYGGMTTNVQLRTSVTAGTHTVVITALFQKNARSSGYYFYFDYLWPLVPQDVPDAPQEYSDVSLAIDFDTDHGYRKPPAWHVWQLQKLGFKGHADLYMGVFWNNKRRRVEATYPYATVEFSGDPVPGDTVYISIGGTQIIHAIGYGETLLDVVSQMRAAINGMFAGVWADNNFGSSATLRIQSKAPAWSFPDVEVSNPNSLTLTLTNHLDVPGAEGDWELVDTVSPVMTEGARRWIRDLASQFAAAAILASFAFSMEVYRPPAAMAARYWDGSPVELDVPSTQMHFGARVRNYLRQMYKECADEIAAAGLPVVLQFGETQWWYFPNASGMPFYDDETKAAFQARYGRSMHRFLANTDDPNDDIETADFLRDRIWAYCQDVISYVRQYHPTAVFECLWPLDANQGKPAPDPACRRLNMHVNLPHEWKTSAYGVKYFRAEGFDYDVWQKNANLMRQTMAFPFATLGRPPEECMYLAGIYGPPDPPLREAYGAWRNSGLYSFCLWAFDQFCLNSRPVPLEVSGQQQARGTAVMYHRPRATRALEAMLARAVEHEDGGALNRFACNTRRLD
jgi:hypothetical protein